MMLAVQVDFANFVKWLIFLIQFIELYFGNEFLYILGWDLVKMAIKDNKTFLLNIVQYEDHILEESDSY